MAEVAHSWTQPCCERCWIEAEGEWDVIVHSGEVRQWPISVRRPVIALDTPIERCSWCGGPTIMGIFKRADPALVPFPAVKEIEDAETGGLV